MKDQYQSPFIGQVWQRKNDWWRYALTLFAIYIGNIVFDFLGISAISDAGVSTSLRYILSNFLGLAILLLFFKPLHDAPVSQLFSIFKTIRPKHLLWGSITGIIVFICEPLVSILLYDIDSVKWVNSPIALFKALFAGVFLGIGYATVSIIQLGYLLPALVKWLKRPLIAGILIWIYANFSYIQYLLFQGDGVLSLDTLQFLFGSLPFLLLLTAWVLMDDSLELIIGLMVGLSIVNNVIIKLGNGVGSWGRTLVEVFLEDNNMDYLMGSFVRNLALILASIVLYQKIPWNNWRSRLLTKYEKPAIHDDWQDRIDEIGGGNEK